MSTHSEEKLSRKVRYFSYFRHFWAAGTDLIFPPRCGLCDRQDPPFTVPTLCQACWQDIYCPIQLLAKTWAGGAYEGHFKDLIGRAKFQADPLALSPLLFLMEELTQTYVKNPWPEILISIPGSPARIRERGINLPHSLARHLHRTFKIPYEKSFLQRVKEVPSQQGLNRTARQKNLKGCFEASPLVNEKHILLVDDVTTTGATLEEAMKTLKKQNSASVTCLVLAKTL